MFDTIHVQPSKVIYESEWGREWKREREFIWTVYLRIKTVIVS